MDVRAAIFGMGRNKAHFVLVVFRFWLMNNDSKLWRNVIELLFCFGKQIFA